VGRIETVYVRATTKGGVTDLLRIDIEVCGHESVFGSGSLTFNYPPKIGPQIIPASTYTYRFSVIGSTQCPIVSYSLLDSDGNDYLGTSLQIESTTGDLIIKTRTPIYATFFLKASTRVKSATIPLNVEVCGFETVSVIQNSTNYTFNG
jgi:hypothetical protein